MPRVLRSTATAFGPTGLKRPEAYEGLPRAPLLDWSTFIAEQQARTAHALQLADSILADAPALSVAAHLLGGWAFAQTEHRLSALLTRLRSVEVRPSPAQLAAGLAAPPTAGPPPAALQVHLQHLHQRAPEEAIPDSPRHRLAWLLLRLSRLGDRVHREEREAWQCPAPVDAKADARAQASWTALAGGGIWSVHDHLQVQWMPEARRGFRGGLRARGVPGHLWADYVREFEDGFLFYMVGGRDAVPGWQDVALRVLEWNGASAISGLARLVPPNRWARVLTCSKATTPAWRNARSWLLPELALPLARTWALRDQLQSGELDLEVAMDGMLALRLLSAWAEDAASAEPERAWRVVLHHRQRTRGRLRAVLLEQSLDWTEALTHTPGLAARTRQALRRYAWAQACEVVRHQGLPSWEDGPTPACAPSPPLPEPLPEAVRASLQSWALLCILRGSLDQLLHWSTTGQWLRRPDSGWGRLLQDGLPGAARDENGGYERVQAVLSTELPSMLGALRPKLEAVAEAPNTKAMKQVLLDGWSPDVAPPARLQKKMAGYAREALERLAANAT
jgi:hypothetical protein